MNSSENDHSLMRLALPLMTKFRIPVTPQNYAVWYAYVAGANEALRQAIDGILEKNQQFSDQINEQLYRRFGLDIDAQEMQKLRDDLKQLLVAILEQVGLFCGRTSDFESTLNESVEKLSKDISLQDLKTIIDNITHETRSIGGAGQLIHTSLEQKSKELSELKERFEQAREEVLRDFLTGIANRKAFDEALSKMARESIRDKNSLCLLMVDIDHFKSFNDNYGHIIGDEVLKFVARKIKELIRGGDMVARYGGEEFGVLLPQTSLGGAVSVAENLRRYFSQSKLKTSTAQALGNINISVGAARYRPGEKNEDFIHRADQALYLAKKTGRNRVVAESEVF